MYVEKKREIKLNSFLRFLGKQIILGKHAQTLSIYSSSEEVCDR